MFTCTVLSERDTNEWSFLLLGIVRDSAKRCSKLLCSLVAIVFTAAVATRNELLVC